MMNKKEILTQKKAKQNPAGGVVVGKRNGQTMIYDDASVGGYFVGKLHSEGGIKMINKSTGQPLEVQGSEVIITAPAVADQTKREFEGEMLTNRQILSKINKRGGGVSFADGGDIPTEMHFSGNSYKYGGKTVTDHEIAYEISKCGCEHGGHLSKGMSLKQIAKMHGVTLLELNRQVKMGLDAESEHTSKVTEQMKIVKDHLYENPNYYSLLKKSGLKKGGEVDYVTYKDKYNKKYNYDKNTSHTLEDISDDTGVSVKGLQQIYNKGIGAYKTNPSSVRPNVKSKEQWAMARVYSAVMGGKASEIDSNELKMNHGGNVKNSLVKDAKDGNSPSRDLNNYNDLMDVQADNAVGGDSGIFANGGTLGASGLPLVDYIVIINGGSHLKGLRSNDKYYDFQSLKKRVAEEYKLLPTSPMYRGYIEAQAYDTEGNELATPNTYISDMKNTVKNFNPYTGKPSDLEKSFANSRPVSFKKYDWSEWFSGKKSMPSTQASSTQTSASTTSTLVEVPDNDPNFDKLVKSLPPPILGLLMIRALEQGISVDNDTLEQKITLVKNKIDGKIFAFSDSQEGGLFWSEISKGRFTEFKRLYGKYGEKVKDIKINIPTTATATASKTLSKKDLEYIKIKINSDFDLALKVVEKLEQFGFSNTSALKRRISDKSIIYGIWTNDTTYLGWLEGEVAFNDYNSKEIFPSDLFGGSTATAQPSATQSSKFTSAEIKLFKAIDDIILENSFRNVKLPIIEWANGTSTKDFDLVNEDTGEVFMLRSHNGILGIQKEDIDLTKSLALLKDYLDWKSGKSTSATSTSTAQTTSSGKFQPSEIEMFEKIDEILKDNSLRYVNYAEWTKSSSTNDFSILNRLTREYLKLRSFSGELGLQKEDSNKIKSKELLKDYLDWKGGQSTSATPTSTVQTATAQPASSKFTKGENDMFQKMYDYVTKNNLRVVDIGLTVTTNTEFIPFIDEETNTRHFALKFQDALAFDINSAQDKEFIKKYLEWLQEKQSGISTATTATQTQPTAPLTEEQKIASEFVADDSVLRRNDILGSASFQSDRNDLDALTKLLPSFQQSKFSNEKASILKEMARIQKKLDYKGFIASNEEVSKGKDLFTPQGLLNYYFTQATQNPTAELQPPCELPTPNGAKSKLPLSAYLNVRSSQFKKWFGDWEKAYETDNYVNCSKMIDEETKEPKIFYHGVRKYIPSFGQMSNMGVGVVRPYGSFEPPNFPASYFANNESYANFYGGIAENMPKPSEGYKPFIYKVFLSIKNPISLLPLDFEVSYRDLIDYILVAYGVRLSINSVLLKQLGDDMDKKHPMWIYIRRDIGLIEMLKDYGYDALIQQGDIPVFDKSGNVVEDRSKYIKDIEYLSFYPNQVKSATVKKSFYFNFFNDIRFKKGGYVRI